MPTTYNMLDWWLLDKKLRSANYMIGYKPLNSIAVSSVSIAGNVLTVKGTNSLTVGQFVKLGGLTSATFLNGVTITIATASATQITAALTHADYAQHSDTGTDYAISNVIYSQLDKNRFWLIKGKGNKPPAPAGSGGWPWDIKLYDTDASQNPSATGNIYFSTTELNFTDPGAGKRFESLNPAIGLHGWPICKIFAQIGDILQSTDSRVVIYNNGLPTSNFILGDGQGELHGPFSGMNYGGSLPNSLIEIVVYHRWGGNGHTSGVYNTQEEFHLGYDPVTDTHYGVVLWLTKNWNSSTASYGPPTNQSIFNQLTPGTAGLPGYDPAGLEGPNLPPLVTSVTPNTGTTAGGDALVIKGSGFTGATTVTIGGLSVSGTVINDGQINVTTPAESAGTVDILVTGPSGTSAAMASDLFTFSPPIIPPPPPPPPPPQAGAGTSNIPASDFGLTRMKLVDQNGIATPEFARIIKKQLAPTLNAVDQQGIVKSKGADFSRTYQNKHLDNIPDGTTYARPLQTALNSGQVDLSKTGVIGPLGSTKVKQNVMFNYSNNAIVDSIDNGTNATIRVYGSAGGVGTTWHQIIGTAIGPEIPSFSGAFNYNTDYYVYYNNGYFVTTDPSQTLPDGILFSGLLHTVSAGGGGGTGGGGGGAGGGGGGGGGRLK